MANKILEGAQEGFESLTQTLDSTAKTYLSLEKIIPDIIDLFSQQASDVRMLNKELGNGSKLAGEFRKEIIDISKSIGIASRDTLRLVEATKEYHQGITDSTEATLKFQKASGVSMGILGKFAAKVNILGNISAKTHDKMYENILAVRDAYGLTDEQIGDVVVSLTNYAVATQASDEQILKASVSLSKFTSLLTSAGIEADRVATILDNMLDPERMMDNVVLMNRMGITVNDMVSGDPTAKLEEGVVKLKELGQEIANIAKNNRLQASEIAKVYNLTLQEAIQLSELDTSEKALNTQKKLDEYRNETASLIESLGTFKETVIGYAASLINPWLEGFERLEGKMGLMSKGLIGLGTILVSKWVLGKFRDGILSLFGEAAKKFSNDMANYLGKVDSRMGAKNAEMAGLAPKQANNANSIKYGFGYDFGIRAQNRNEAANKRFYGFKARREYNLTAGEIIDAKTNVENQLLELEEMGKKLTGTRLEAFNSKFGGINVLKQRREALNQINSGSKFESGENTIGQYITGFNTYKGATKNTKANQLLGEFSKRFGFVGNYAEGKSQEERNAIAGVIAGSKDYRDALEKLSIFFKEKGLTEQIEKTTNALMSFDEEIEKSYQTNKNAQKALENAQKVANGEGAGSNPLLNRFKALGQGALENIEAFGKNLVVGFKNTIKGIRDFLKPSNLFGLLGKGLKFGALGILGGVGVKFMASLSKNEKFQESMTTISEKISTIFDGLVAAVEPIVEPVANAIMGIFNWLQPAIDWLSKILGKIAGWFGGVLNKSVSNISKNVTTISDSYKQEDLKTMVAATALKYDIGSDSLAVQMGDVVNLITGISKKIDEGNLLAITNSQSK